MIDITIKYRFKNLEYLVADAKGNFYLLEHFSNRRIKPFRKLKKSKYRVNYLGIAYSLSTLRKLAIRYE